MTVNLLDFERTGFAQFCAGLGEKPFRARQLMRWIHQSGADDFDAMTDISKASREEMKKLAVIRAPAVVRDTTAADGTRKWLLNVGTGNAIETVFIPERNRGTLCVSSQAGCALACTFCSTGRQGFNRNLTVAEIIGQLWLANREFGRSVEIKPDFAYGHYYAGLAYQKLRQTAKMSQHLETFLRLAPEAPERAAVAAVLRTLRGHR